VTKPGYYWIKQRGRAARSRPLVAFYQNGEWQYGGGAGTDDQRRLNVLHGPLQPSDSVIPPPPPLTNGYYWVTCNGDPLIAELIAGEWGEIDDTRPLTNDLRVVEGPLREP
jgi:hypothetical protein